MRDGDTVRVIFPYIPLLVSLAFAGCGEGEPPRVKERPAAAGPKARPALRKATITPLPRTVPSEIDGTLITGAIYAAMVPVPVPVSSPSDQPTRAKIDACVERTLGVWQGPKTDLRLIEDWRPLRPDAPVAIAQVVHSLETDDLPASSAPAALPRLSPNAPVYIVGPCSGEMRISLDRPIHYPPYAFISGSRFACKKERFVQIWLREEETWTQIAAAAFPEAGIIECYSDDRPSQQFLAVQSRVRP